MIKVYVNGRQLTENEDWEFNPVVWVPNKYPWWIKWLSRWIPYFRRGKFVPSPHMEIFNPPGSGEDVRIVYEVDA